MTIPNYNRTTWVNGTTITSAPGGTPPIDQVDLNNIEAGVLLSNQALQELTTGGIGSLQIKATKLPSGAGLAPANNLSDVSSVATSLKNLGTAPWVTAEKYGAVGDGVTDDTTAINNALAASKYVVLGEKTYLINGLVTVPWAAQLVGRGYLNESTGAVGPTRLLCGAASAGVAMPNGNCGLRDLHIDGNLTANVGLLLGSTTNGTPARDELKLARVAVTNTLVTGVSVQGVQNSLFEEMRISANHGVGLLIDRGAGGLKFIRCEVAASAGFELQIKGTSQTGISSYVTPAHVTFDTCIFEARSTAGSEVQLEAGYTILFDHCGFSTNVSTAGDTSPLVNWIGTGSVEIRTPIFYSGAYRPCIAVKGVATTTQPMLVLTGLVNANTDGPAIIDNDSNGEVLMNAQLQGYGYTGVLRLFTAGSVVNAIIDYNIVKSQWIMDTSARIAHNVQVAGDTYPRYSIDAQGNMAWGPGGATPTDTTLTRAAANVLALQLNGVFRTGHGPTASRPSASAVGAASQWYDDTLAKPIWSNGTVWKDASGTTV